MPDDARTEQSVLLIQSWLSKTPHIPPLKDDMVRKFLRGRKYSLEETKKVLELHFAVRTIVPEFFTDTDPTSAALKKLRENVHFFRLPKKSVEGYHILVSRWRRPDVADFSTDDYVKHGQMVLRVMLQEYDTTEVVIIYDMWKFTLTQFLKFMTVPFMKKYVLVSQDALPIRVKQIHITNATPFVDKVLALMKPLMKEKLRKRVYVHLNNESLQKYLPKDVLAAEHGGDLECLDKINDEWGKKLEEYRDFFLNEEKITQQLPLPPATVLNHSELFGVEGSFRKLSID